MAISGNEVKRVRSLRDKKGRDETGLFIVEGEKMLAETVRSGYVVERVYRRDDIGEAAMARISLAATPSPVLALVRKPAGLDIPDAGAVLGPGLHLALDGIRDPGNLGTILRLADWFGLGSVLLSADTVDPFNPKVVQSTMGAIFRVRCHRTDLVRSCRSVRERGGTVCGTFLEGEDIFRQELPAGRDAPVIIVIGSESFGISPAVAAEVSVRLTIPPYPLGVSGSESLNAATAAAITIAEFRRRP